jgi:hypothetical protein
MEGLFVSTLTEEMGKDGHSTGADDQQWQNGNLFRFHQQGHEQGVTDGGKGLGLAT